VDLLPRRGVVLFAAEQEHRAGNAAQAEADADAGLRDVLARVLEANERWEQLAAELRAEENAQLREENAVYRGWPVSPFGDRLRAPISRSGVAGSALSAMTQATG
jgi:hypothetical protein